MAEVSKPRMSMTELMELYGGVALGVSLLLFALEMAVLVTLLKVGVDITPLTDWLASTFGWQIDEGAQSASAWPIAYGITRLLKPFQIGATVVLTPPVASVVDRFRGRAAPEPEPDQAPAAPADSAGE